MNKKEKKSVHAVMKKKNSEDVEINNNDYERIVFVFITQVVASK